MEAKKSVLVVDDDIMLLKIAEELLITQYAVSLSKSAGQAIQLLQKGFMPDIILLDIDMPDMDGYEAIEKFRQLPHLQDVPVIFLTGLTKSQDELRGLRAGASDYITKPFERDILLARLELHLKNGEQRRSFRALQQTFQAPGINEKKIGCFTGDSTPTEQKVARLIALGYTNQEIGEKLHYSYSYVKKVACVIFEKLNVNKRNELRKLLM